MEEIIQLIKDRRKQSLITRDEANFLGVLETKVNNYVSGRSELFNFLEFAKNEMHVSIQWNNKYLIEMYERKLSNSHN